MKKIFVLLALIFVASCDAYLNEPLFDIDQPVNTTEQQPLSPGDTTEQKPLSPGDDLDRMGYYSVGVNRGILMTLLVRQTKETSSEFSIAVHNCFVNHPGFIRVSNVLSLIAFVDQPIDAEAILIDGASMADDLFYYCVGRVSQERSDAGQT